MAELRPAGNVTRAEHLAALRPRVLALIDDGNLQAALEAMENGIRTHPGAYSALVILILHREGTRCVDEGDARCMRVMVETLCGPPLDGGAKP